MDRSSELKPVKTLRTTVHSQKHGFRTKSKLYTFIKHQEANEAVANKCHAFVNAFGVRRKAMRTFKSILLILFTICTSAVYGQLKQTKHFSKQSEINSLCSQSILLDSLGYFFTEKGCEGTSTISFGRYKISKNNVVSFSFLPIDSLQPFKEIKRYKNPNDSLLTFILYDRFGKPLSHTYNFESVDINGKTESVRSDEKGRVILNREKYQDLIITPLIWIYQRQVQLVTGDENNIEVHLALPTMFLMYNQITFEQPVKQQLILKKDGLYKLNKKIKVYSADN